MKGYMVFGLSLLLAGAWFSAESNAQTVAPESHEAAAKAAAYTPGHDFTWIFDRLCGEFSTNVINAPDPEPRPASRAVPPREEWYAPPAKIFDNLYYVGSYLHSMWAVTTSEGIILHDSAFDYMVDDEIVDGLRQMGLDAADIKYVIISHGHSDHYFGAKTLQDRYGARITMSEADWNLVANDANPPEIQPRKDMVATDGMELTLGDTTLRLYLTPGHTPGTISTLIPLKDGDRWHLGSVWGGNALGGRHFPERSQALATYGASADRFRDITARARVDVFLASHTNHDKTLERINALRFRKPGEPHPFVNAEAVERHLTVVGQCAEAQLGWFLESQQ